MIVADLTSSPHLLSSSPCPVPSCVQPEGSPEPTIGTTAEIYEVREESQDAYMAFSIKAKGRQRFRLVSKRSTVDG